MVNHQLHPHVDASAEGQAGKLAGWPTDGRIVREPSPERDAIGVSSGQGGGLRAEADTRGGT